MNNQPRCQQNCQQKVVNEYARVVDDFARLLCWIVVKSVQIKGLEVQILPLEPFLSGFQTAAYRVNRAQFEEVSTDALIFKDLRKASRASGTLSQ
jgi:hypothetical protein